MALKYGGPSSSTRKDGENLLEAVRQARKDRENSVEHWKSLYEASKVTIDNLIQQMADKSVLLSYVNKELHRLRREGVDVKLPEEYLRDAQTIGSCREADPTKKERWEQEVWEIMLHQFLASVKISKRSWVFFTTGAGCYCSDDGVVILNHHKFGTIFPSWLKKLS